MKSHEIKVKNKDGIESTVSIEHYLANKTQLSPVMEDKELKSHIEAHEKEKTEARAKLAEENKVKMEKEALKNKGR